MENLPRQSIPEHEKFKSGQGYGSAEPGADAQAHPREEQYGDNPLPPSGGDWRRAGELQPDVDPESDLQGDAEGSPDDPADRNPDDGPDDDPGDDPGDQSSNARE